MLANKWYYQGNDYLSLQLYFNGISTFTKLSKQLYLYKKFKKI